MALHQREVGKLPLEIPPFAGFSWTPADVLGVIPEAFGLAFVSSVNILITSRVVEHFRGRHKHLKPADADTELGAYGIANMVAGVFAAPMSVGIPARSLASVRCGGTTRLSNIFHALFIFGFSRPRRELHLAHSHSRARRRYGLHRYLPARMEHLAAAAAHAESGRRRFP